MTLATLEAPALRADLLTVDHPAVEPVGPRTWGKNPFVRLAAWVGLAAIGFLLIYMPTAFLSHELLVTWGGPLTAISIAGPAALAYWLVNRFLEDRRPQAEFRRPLAGIGAGLALGFVALTVCVGVIWTLGGIRFHGTQFPADWSVLFWIAGLQAGIAEEIAFRGIGFRYLEEGLGTWGALAVSALAFGAAHLGNPDATWWSAVAIALEAGILFGAVYALTRSLWVSIGLHFAWNLAQGLLFSIPVSGGRVVGWLVSEPAGSELVSGGRFGVEASIVTVALMAALGLGLCVLVHRRGNVVAPLWVRRRALAVEG